MPTALNNADPAGLGLSVGRKLFAATGRQPLCYEPPELPIARFLESKLLGGQRVFLIVIPVQVTLIGLVMKSRYSLRLFLVAVFALGTVAAFVTEHFSRDTPIQLHAVAIGTPSDDPAVPVEEPTLEEVRRAVHLERQDPRSDISGTVTELKILAVTTSINPPRYVPLIGNARLHRGMFRCSVKLIHSDGSFSNEVVLIEKNAFRLIKSRP